MPERIGRYILESRLGEGGMGVVHAAHDEQLDRPVAIKRIQAVGDESVRLRIWREARTAARVNHPNVCQVYEVGENDRELYIVMERLEGESLASRIARGPIEPTEALKMVLEVLGALEAMHAQGVIHRDLKPSNLFVTPHGIKVLDFGLALPFAGEASGAALRLTLPGVAVGTPRYMAPERWASEPVGPPTDLFSLAAILHEMVTGKPAFQGDDLAAICKAILTEHPPALAGGAAALAVDRILQRALAKRPGDRYPDAASMAGSVREALAGVASGEVVNVRRTTRLVVLPFRLLRPDPDTEFLAVALPDAITTSLAGHESLVVRSSAAAARFATETLDLKAIVEGTDVDVVLTGTLLRAGDRVRVATQLVDAHAGTVLWSRATQGQVVDVFQLQDDLAREIVESLSLSLTSGEHRTPRRDVPASPLAYEFFLRANQIGVNVYTKSLLEGARDLYRRCLAEDPGFAPAWARLGRVYRVMAKYDHGPVEENVARAQECFERAFAISPDLPLAHNFYTYFEIENLGRPREAMTRLLDRVRSHSADPELFAGLVVACRFCGLLQASLAADRRARQLDPTIMTSVPFTYMMLGDFQRVLDTQEPDMPFARVIALAALARSSESKEAIREIQRRHLEGVEKHFMELVLAAVDGDREGCLRACEHVDLSLLADPEALYFVGRWLALVGAHEEALENIERAVERGLCTAWTFERDEALVGLRETPRFTALLARAAAGREAAVQDYVRCGGERLLGVPASAE